MTARNAFCGPGFWNLDLSAAKTFEIKERYKLQLRAEVFNIFNHANLYVDTISTNVAAYDFVPAYRSGRRQVQLAMKFIF